MKCFTDEIEDDDLDKQCKSSNTLMRSSIGDTHVVLSSDDGKLFFHFSFNHLKLYKTS